MNNTNKKNKNKQVRVYRTIIMVALILACLFLILIINKLPKNKSISYRQINALDGKKNIDNNGKDIEKKVKNNSYKIVVEDSTLPKAPTNNDQYLKAKDQDYITNNGFKLTIKDGVASIDGNVIANKTFSLPENYSAKDPLNPDFAGYGRDGSDGGLEKYVIDAFNVLQNDASSLGLNVYITSGYRCYDAQKGIYDSCCNSYGKEYTDTFSSRPGCSEHQTGLAFDLNTIEDSFANTNEGKWINDNCYKYGFILRFPKGKDNYTGYQYESWHLRYVGKKLAKILYNNGDWISLEEYYGITSCYQ